MVSTLDSHPADRGSIPHIYLNFFLFFLVILLRKYSLIIQKVQNSTQKLFVQFHYFKLFMYVYITYNEKKESKVLGHLLLITIIFWTVCEVLQKSFDFKPKIYIQSDQNILKSVENFWSDGIGIWHFLHYWSKLNHSTDIFMKGDID